MPSIRSRLFAFVLAHRHLLKGRLRRTTSIDGDTSIPELRAEVERGAAFFGKLPEGFALEPIRIGLVEAEWMRPLGAERNPMFPEATRAMAEICTFARRATGLPAA